MPFVPYNTRLVQDKSDRIALSNRRRDVSGKDGVEGKRGPHSYPDFRAGNRLTDTAYYCDMLGCKAVV